MTISRIAIIALVLAITGDAVADRETDAKLAYDRGAALYKDRHYVDARAEFATGYQLSGRAEFLFNMAECSRLANEPAVAREQYARYLKDEPNGPLADLAHRRLAALPPPQQPVEPVASPPPPSASTNAPTPPTRAPELSPTTAVATPIVPPAADVASQRTATIALGATSLALAAVSLGVGLWGNSIYASAQAATDPTQQDQLWQEANDRRYTAEAIGVVSVGCAGLAVWLYLRAEQHAVIAPVVGPDRATLSLSGEF